MLKPVAVFVVLLAVFSVGFYEGSARSKASSDKLHAAKIEEIGTKNFLLLKENAELQQQYLMSLEALHKLGVKGRSGQEILGRMILEEME